MAVKTEIELTNFFIFNSLFGPVEGEEIKKILFYHPITDNADKKIKNVGLVEGIINFTRTFKPSAPVGSLHTTKSRQLYFQPEEDFWIVMTLSLPTITKVKEGTSNIEYVEDDLQDNVYEAVLKQTYYTYRLFHGKFNSIVNVDKLKTTLELFFKPHLSSLKLANADILSIFSGIQYLPLDSQTFLKVQSFVNNLESRYSVLKYTAFLYNEHLIWSGLEPNDMKIIYQYMIATLLPSNLESELRGGSLPRNSQAPFALLRHGKFITGPSDLKLAKTVGKVPKVFLYNEQEPKEYHFVVYRALSATVCLFIEESFELTLDFFRELDEFISPNLLAVTSEIAEFCSGQVVTPSCAVESPKFIYFNKLNLAYKSTVHLDNKQAGNLDCPKEALMIMSDVKKDNFQLGLAGETVMKTLNDFWVVGKVSNCREFYIVLQQKNASLIDVSEEVKKLCQSELKGIYFNPM